MRPFTYRWLLALLLASLTLPALAEDYLAMPVRVAEAVRVTLAPQQWLAATVVSRHEAEIAAEANGRLLSVAEIGTRVASGEVLAHIDDTFAKLKVDELTAAVAREEATLQFLRSEMRRLTRLARQNNTAQTQLDDVASRQLVAVNELSIARTHLAEAKEQLRRHQLRAPFTAVVVERRKRGGEWVSTGDTLLRLVDTSALEVQASAPLSARRFVRPGDHLSVSSDDGSVSGRVRALVPAADARSHRLDLRVTLVGDDLIVGQPLRVAIPRARAREVLAVPRDALLLRGQGAAVFRINDDNQAERVAVTLGIASGDMIAVSGDLQPGDRVVIRGGERLRPGMAVQILADNDGE
ncbi:MAG: efflux RND transporter periplasmic adaptor subunit [Gammaproteobacteria bacterium]|nr:efflux RND transporter periplasmic adaptor subunit [Gammaproteobacteria bacterium]